MKIEMHSNGQLQSTDIDRPQDSTPSDAVYSDVRTPLHPPQKTVRLPLWVPTVVIAFFVLVILILCLALWSMNRNLQQQNSAAADDSSAVFPTVDSETGELISPYLALTAANQQALGYAGLDAEEVTFITSKLNTKVQPPQYEIIFLRHGGTQYEYYIHAESGVLLNYRMQETDTAIDADAFIPMQQAREIALQCAGLSDAIFTKERLDLNDEIYCYKLHFYDGAGRSYNVHLLADAGTVLRYEVEDPLPSGVQYITLADAKKQALSRAGVADANLVTFTKQKRVGAVYLIAFTLEDGTQYTVELDGITGMANTVDVIPVAADTSQFLGFTAAKRIAIEKTGLPADTAVTYTKAKIDRESAAYVYELEFETDTYEYAVSVHAVTGEVIKYEAWFR